MEMNKSPTCDVHKANPHWQPLSSILPLQNTVGGQDMLRVPVGAQPKRDIHILNTQTVTIHMEHK